MPLLMLSMHITHSEVEVLAAESVFAVGGVVIVTIEAAIARSSCSRSRASTSSTWVEVREWTS